MQLSKIKLTLSLLLFLCLLLIYWKCNNSTSKYEFKGVLSSCVYDLSSGKPILLNKREDSIVSDDVKSGKIKFSKDQYCKITDKDYDVNKILECRTLGDIISLTQAGVVFEKNETDANSFTYPFLNAYRYNSRIHLIEVVADTVGKDDQQLEAYKITTLILKDGYLDQISIDK